MNDPRSERRGGPRAATFGEAVVLFDDDTAHRYRIDNLSAGGAQLAGLPALPPFEVLSLVLRVGAIPARTIEARVVWHSDDPIKRYGVTFLNLDADLADAINDVVLGILNGATPTASESIGGALPSWLP